MKFTTDRVVGKVSETVIDSCLKRYLTLRYLMKLTTDRVVGSLQTAEVYYIVPKVWDIFTNTFSIWNKRKNNYLQISQS